LTHSSEARFPLKIDWERVQTHPDGLKAGSLAAIEPPLACFPLKSEWKATQPIKINEYPAPEYTSRDSHDVKLPSAVQKLAQFAREQRWGVIAQSSMGSVPHARTGRPSALKRLVALRFGDRVGSDRRAYVVYESPAAREDWKPRSIMIWGPDLPPYAHLGSADLRLYLAKKVHLPESHLKRWVAEIEKQRQASEAHQKRRMTVRRQIVKTANDGMQEAGRAEDRQEYARIDREWRSKVADLQDGVFTSEEVVTMLQRRGGTYREAL